MNMDIISYLIGMLEYYKNVHKISNVNIGMLRGLGKTETLKSLISMTMAENPDKVVGIFIGHNAMVPQYMDLERKGLKIILSSQSDHYRALSLCDYVYSDEVYNAEQILKSLIENNTIIYKGGFFSSELRPHDVVLYKKTRDCLAESLSSVKKSMIDLLTGTKNNVSEVLALLEKLPD